MQIKENMFCSCVIAGKCDMDNLEDIKNLIEANPVPPKYGRNWWFDKPKIYTDFKLESNFVTVWKFSFLCFIISFDNYRRFDGERFWNINGWG